MSVQSLCVTCARPVLRCPWLRHAGVVRTLKNPVLDRMGALYRVRLLRYQGEPGIPVFDVLECPRYVKGARRRAEAL